jgi:hypothetical protein
VGNVDQVGAKVVSRGRYVTFQMAEVAVSRQTFQGIPAADCAAAGAACTSMRRARDGSDATDDDGRGVPHPAAQPPGIGGMSA